MTKERSQIIEGHLWRLFSLVNIVHVYSNYILFNPVLRSVRSLAFLAISLSSRCLFLPPPLPSFIRLSHHLSPETKTGSFDIGDHICLGGGRNSSVGSAWARCPQRRGFDPPLGTFSGRGDFSLGVNIGSNSIPPKTLSDESINRGLVCAHMHFIARTQKILTFMS